MKLNICLRGDEEKKRREIREEEDGMKMKTDREGRRQGGRKRRAGRRRAGMKISRMLAREDRGKETNKQTHRPTLMRSMESLPQAIAQSGQ